MGGGGSKVSANDFNPATYIAQGKRQMERYLLIF